MPRCLPCQDVLLEIRHLQDNRGKMVRSQRALAAVELWEGEKRHCAVQTREYHIDIRAMAGVTTTNTRSDLSDFRAPLDLLGAWGLRVACYYWLLRRQRGWLRRGVGLFRLWRSEVLGCRFSDRGMSPWHSEIATCRCR